MPPAHAETLALGGDDGGVVSEAIEQRGGELLVTSEDLGPLAEGEVARDDDRPLLVAVGDEVEEQLAAGAIEGDESDLVEEEEFDAGKTALQAGELALVAGFEEGAHQIGRAPEADVAPLSGGLDAEGDSEVGLAGADRPRARSAICAASTPSEALKSKVSSVLSSGKRASRRRWRTADSAREATSTERISCRYSSCVQCSSRAWRARPS